MLDRELTAKMHAILSSGNPRAITALNESIEALYDRFCGQSIEAPDSEGSATEKLLH